MRFPRRYHVPEVAGRYTAAIRTRSNVVGIGATGLGTALAAGDGRRAGRQDMFASTATRLEGLLAALSSLPQGYPIRHHVEAAGG